MNSAEIKRIIGRLLADDAFAQQFRLDPDGCLQQYRLSRAEKDALKALDLTQIEKAHLTILKNLDGATTVLVPTLFSS
jgi:hypothetical protein